MHRLSAVALVAAGLGAAIVVFAVLAVPSQAGSSGLVVKASPSQGLVDRQIVTINGRGLTAAGGASSRTWFVAECTAAVRGRMNPTTDTPHCDLTDAQQLHVTRNGTFSDRFRVRTGIIGDGYCGAAGHATCVLGVGTAQGLGTVVHITFKAAPPATTTS